MKLYVADTWEEALHGPLPVIRLSGTMMGVAGRKQHRIFPFVAIRSKTPFAKIVTGVYPITHERIDPRVREVLTRAIAV